MYRKLEIVKYKSRWYVVGQFKIGRDPWEHFQSRPCRTRGGAEHEMERCERFNEEETAANAERREAIRQIWAERRAQRTAREAAAPKQLHLF